MSRTISMKPQSGTLPIFSVEDIRQFVYCPRIIYFRYVIRGIPLPTTKMNKGSDRHEAWRKRRIRRGIDTDRFYGIYFESEDLGLCGLLDAVDFDGKIARPVELKTGKYRRGEVSAHHRAQVIAQCALVEASIDAVVDSGVVVYESTGEQFSIRFTDDARIWLYETLTEMRRIIMNEDLPPPTTAEQKCEDCEYWSWCQRV